MNLSKLTRSHVRKVVRARRRWARLTVEDRIGLFIRRWPMYGTAPAELGHLLHSLDVSCVVDVGAHEGGFGRLVRRLGFKGGILSFEPATATFRELERRTRHDPTWKVHRLALGSVAGQMQLDVYEQTQLNSLRRPLSVISQPIDARPTSVELVDVVRLDDVWSQLIPDFNRTLLKIDAQGFDLEVLRGADASLAACAALQIELSGTPLYDGSPTLHEVIAYLYDRSFHITGLFPIMRHPANRLQVIDFDATFVRVPDEGPAISVG